MNNFYWQITLVLNLGFKTEEHKYAPFVASNEEFEEKIDNYTSYDTWDFTTSDCVDEYGNAYRLVLNSNLLKNSYFKFYCVGAVIPESVVG